MKQGIWFALVLALCTASADLVAGKAEIRNQAEMSMLVTGSIDIEADGSVSAYRIDREDQVPETVRKLVDVSVSGWRFEPVLANGRPIAVQTPVTLRIVASPRDAGDYVVRIAGASFLHETKRENEDLRPIDMSPPKYPPVAYRRGIEGIVYLLLQVGRDGTVAAVATEQVNLTVVGRRNEMEEGRRWLSNAAMEHAKTWRFVPPTKGEDAGASVWYLRIPVEFHRTTDRAAAYGTWTAYVPGPKARPQWIEAATAESGSDALVAGGIYLVENEPKLLTPLQDG